MKLLTEPCPRCGSQAVAAPTKVQIKQSLILVRCENCNRMVRYNIVDHVDDTKGYYLSKWGRGEKRPVVRRVRNLYADQTHFTSQEIREALDKVYGYIV